MLNIRDLQHPAMNRPKLLLPSTLLNRLVQVGLTHPPSLLMTRRHPLASMLAFVCENIQHGLVFRVFDATNKPLDEAFLYLGVDVAILNHVVT